MLNEESPREDRSAIFERCPSVERALREIAGTMVSSLSTSISATPDALFAIGRKWIDGFVSKPHPDLGRSGNVCPFVEVSEQSHCLYFSKMDAAGLSLLGVTLVLLDLIGLCRARQLALDVSAELFSLVVFVKDVPTSDYSKFIDLAQKIVKPIYMESGLTLGAFHPESNIPGAHSQSFRPNKSDAPMFVIRALSPHDILFIDRTESPAVVRRHELECYIDTLGDKMSERQKTAVSARLSALRVNV